MNRIQFYKKINEFAKTHHMKCTLGTDYYGWSVCVEYAFSDGFCKIRRSETYMVKEREGGKVNYVSRRIHDGRCRYSGDGYGIFEQKPIFLEDLCYKFLKELEDSYRYYQPIT